MLQYTLEVTLCWSVLYTIFYAFLRRETYFSINRWYLLISILLGLLIPLLRFIDIDFGQESVAQSLPLIYVLKDAPMQMTVSVVDATQDWHQIWMTALYVIYTLGVLFFLVRLGRSIFKIKQLYSKGTKIQNKQYTIVNTHQAHLPFSFLNSVYISTLTELSDDYEHVLQHELSHVRSRHSLDVLFIEMINVLFWFHPLVYIYKTALRQTHEYLADHAVLQNTTKKIYGTMLLKQSLSGLEIALAHHFFHSHIKKRINMMYQKKSGPSAWLKYALALPVLLFLTVVFAKQSNTVIATDENSIIQVSEFDKEAFLIQLNEIGTQKKNIESLQSELTDYVKSYLVRYPKLKKEILWAACTPQNQRGALIYFEGISLKDADIDSVDYDLNGFKIVIRAVFAEASIRSQFEELNGPTPIPDLIDLDLLYENSPERINEKAKAIWVYNMYAHEYTTNPNKLKALDQQMAAFIASKGIDLGIGLDKLHPVSNSFASADLKQYAKLTRMDDVPIIWNNEFMINREIGISMDLDKPIASIIHLSPSDASKVFGSEGEKGFYSMVGYQQPFENPNRQHELLKKDVENFFSTIDQWPEKDWVNKLKSVHKDLQKKYPKVGDVITPHTNAARQHNITLVIKDKEIISAYKGNGDSTVRIDEDKTEIALNGKRINHPKLLDSVFSISEYDNRIYICTEPLEEDQITVLANNEILTINKDYTLEDKAGTVLILNEKLIKDRVPIKIEFSNTNPDTIKVEEIFKVVQVMPRFPGCEYTAMSDAEKKSCADQKLLEYLYSTLKYPELARKNEIQGRVYIQFIVEKDGSISRANIVRDVGSGLGQAALEAVENMNNLPAKWSPGKQRGEAVRVLYTLPVSFTLEEEGKSLNKKDQPIFKSNNDSAQPLIVINGHIQNSTKIEDLQSGSIEEVSVLKDEVALKKYGEQGLNGVIEIILKENASINHNEVDTIITFDPVTLTESVQIVKSTKGQNKVNLKGDLVNQSQPDIIKPLIVLDGIVKRDLDINTIDPDDIAEMSMLKGKAAAEKYGEQAVRGVFEIITKNPLKNSKNKNKEKATDASFKLDGSARSITIRGKDSEKGNSSIKPLFVIDGKIRTDSNIEDIDPDDIKVIKVLKDEPAIKKYGQEGQHGVIEITLKKKRKN